MYAVYIDDDMSSYTYDIEKIYSPDKGDIAEGYVIYDTSCEKELNSAGSFGFTIPPSNPMYSRIVKLKTTVFVFWDSDLLWVGRVLSTAFDLSGGKIVRCEECQAFLNDIIIKPFVYTGAVTKRTYAQHLSDIIGIYNNRCSAKRVFQTVSVSLPDEFSDIDIYSSPGVTSYVSVKEEIDSIIAADDSLALAVHYQTLGMPELAVSSVPFRTVPNVLESGYNMLSFDEADDGSQLFTSVIPLGDDSLTIDDTDYALTSSTLVGKYGIIEKAVQISGIKTAADLRAAGLNILRTAEAEDNPDIVVRAVDMKWLDPVNVPKFIEVGDAVPVKLPNREINHYYLCEKISFDLESPDNAVYTLSYLGTSVPQSGEYGNIRYSPGLSDYILDSSRAIEKQALSDVQRPSGISVSSNEVAVTYPGYSVVYRADGSGDERTNIHASVVNGGQS